MNAPLRRTASVADALRYEVEAWAKLATPEARAVVRRSTFQGDPPYPAFGGLNGQSYRAKTVLNLMHRLPIDGFVETGTFHGFTSALIAAQTGLPVFTVEVKRRYFIAAQAWRVQFPRRLHMVHDDSRSFLESSRLNGLKYPFIYLDAHWNDDLPLVEEMEIISRRFPESVVLIDDFKVPGDADYGFDEYGDLALDMDLIRPTLPEGTRAFYPAVPAKRETGHFFVDGRAMYPRGWVILSSSPKAIAAMETEPALRPEPT